MKLLKRKSLYILLTFVLCISMVCVSCYGKKDRDSSVVVTTSLEDREVLVGNIPCSFPLTDEGASLNILYSWGTYHQDNDIYVWNKYEEMTGVNVNWTLISKSDRKEAVNTALMNKTDLDIILRCKISTNLLNQYGESGSIYNLMENNMLEKYAPNCWAYLQSHPDSLASIQNPDGTIYSLPQINAGAELRVAKKIFINKHWLENVKMEIPSTTEEFYKMLKAFSEQDANNNGDPNDEIPLSSHDWDSLQESFFGAFGLANRGLHNQLVDYNDATGKVRLIAYSDSYKQFLEYLNRLYSEQLLDNSVFTSSLEQLQNNISNDKIGAFAITNLATLPADKINDWVAIEEALEGPNGDKLWTAIRANFHSVGAAVIPTTCDNPELALRWLDYFWTDEGTLFYHMGIESETFVVKKDGTFDYTPEIYQEMTTNNLSFDEVISKYSPYPGGSNPTVETAPYFMGGEMADIPAAAARKLFVYGPEVYWPSFTFSGAETEQISSIQNDISKYIDSSRIAFISGTMSFSEWDSYKTTLEHFGMDELLSVYQAAADRYDALRATTE